MTTPARKLLDRESFERAVFARHGGRCVFCARPAVDAHHILERKLFADLGYYVENGAPVCSEHHWDCETTRLSVAEVLAACGLPSPCLPPGFSVDATFDKWGNRMRRDGLREPGPLFHDTGCQRALRAGGFLGLFVPVGTPEI